MDGSTPSSRDKKKSANRARHRLLSIQYDVQHYLKPILARQESPPPVLVANERCGTWYALPFQPHSFCHFKSTDGHIHLFSLKRLNLPLLKTLADDRVVWIVDASNKKEMPDSFSRTIPLWACVLNRTANIYRKELQQPALFSNDDDLKLFLPHWVVPEPERQQMESLIDARVQELYQSQAIVDIPGFIQLMTKPLRPFWITPLNAQQLLTPEELQSCLPIVCCNASNSRLGGGNNRIVWRKEGQFWYTPGAADDHESWARHLTPQLFWGQLQSGFSPSMSDQQVEDWIDQVVKESQKESSLVEDNKEDHAFHFDWIGHLNLAIGTRRAGRPPNCWKHFDAVLNVTNTEYDEMLEVGDKEKNKFYLQLPVEEGKRDKQELERWMALGVVFCAHHARQKRRILIHCAQGRDRSVAVAMAVIQLFCHARYPLQWNWQLLENSVDEVLSFSGDGKGNTDTTAGIPIDLTTILFDREGRDKLLGIVRCCLQKAKGWPIASKESLRVVLHLIRQDREKAEPTRSTMQKLNRFFMSETY